MPHSTPIILLLYSYYHHHIMVERLASEMGAYGLGVDIICKDNYQVIRNSGRKWSLLTEWLMWLLRSFKIVRCRKLSRLLFQNYLFSEIVRHYDLIDFHVFSPDRIPFMRVCVEQGVPFDITIWGSEILRATPELLDLMKYGFDYCRFIKAVPNLQAAISEKYAGRFDDKLRTAYFGNGEYEIIDTVGDDIVSSVRNQLNVRADDCIIACGYNASRGQQHLRIVESLNALPANIKSSIFLLFQMTYPSDLEYTSIVSQAAAKSGIRYKVLDQYLSSDEVAAIRKLGDVVVNMQTTDAFSGSLQGALYAGRILIIGEWLSYPALDDKGVFYLKVSFDSLAGMVADVVSRKEYYQFQCARNHSIMKGLTSWPAVIGDWAKLYDEL